MQTKTMKVLDVSLVRLRLAVNNEILWRLLATVETEIASCYERIDEVSDSLDSIYADTVIDSESEMIEELIGWAFVAAQTALTAIATRAEILYQRCYPNDKKLESFKICCRKLDDSELTVIEGIDAVANFWKHHDSWRIGKGGEGEPDVVWRSAKGMQETTMKRVQSLGMKPGCTGNIRTAAEALGVKSYSDLSPIYNEIKAWGVLLLSRSEKEVAALHAEKITSPRRK